MSAVTQRVGLLVIGDEILSGKRQDRHIPAVIDMLWRRGIELAWGQILGDDEQRIAASLRRAADDGDAVLCCGGIGATPDDVTRQAAALAAGRPIALHPEGAALLREKFGEQATPQRLRMAEFPEGAELVPNPINQVAGFSIHSWFFVPGFPEMAWPMLEWVIDHRLQHLHNAEPAEEYRLRVVGTTGESDILHIMEAILARYAGIRLSSLPTRSNEAHARHIELGVRGAASLAASAYAELLRYLHDHGGLQVEELRPPGIQPRG
ncbi:molybdopterin-binding protein [Algiphilus sp.]|uniref:competence/damage-inducible protein A n=1 Tax=Algiphilus sp. TaxID=1872431 RepID=UPI0032EC336B